MQSATIRTRVQKKESPRQRFDRIYNLIKKYGMLSEYMNEDIFEKMMDVVNFNLYCSYKSGKKISEYKKLLCEKYAVIEKDVETEIQSEENNVGEFQLVKTLERIDQLLNKNDVESILDIIHSKIEKDNDYAILDALTYFNIETISERICKIMSDYIKDHIIEFDQAITPHCLIGSKVRLYEIQKNWFLNLYKPNLNIHMIHSKCLKMIYAHMIMKRSDNRYIKTNFNLKGLRKLSSLLSKNLSEDAKYQIYDLFKKCKKGRIIKPGYEVLIENNFKDPYDRSYMIERMIKYDISTTEFDYMEIKNDLIIRDEFTNQIIGYKLGKDVIINH